MDKKCICQVCGAEFEVANRAGAKYCPECRKTAYKKQQREKYHEDVKRKIERTAADKSQHDITEVQKQASTLGLSYGKYVALQKKEKDMKAKTITEETTGAAKSDIIRSLITQALKQLNFSGADFPKEKNIGAAIGLLTAAEMLLGGDVA